MAAEGNGLHLGARASRGRAAADGPELQQSNMPTSQRSKQSTPLGRQQLNTQVCFGLALTTKRVPLAAQPASPPPRLEYAAAISRFSFLTRLQMPAASPTTDMIRTS